METIKSIEFKKKVIKAVNNLSLSKDEKDYNYKYDEIQGAYMDYSRRYPEDEEFRVIVEEKINEAESKLKFLPSYNESKSEEIELKSWGINKANSTPNENSGKEEVNIENDTSKDIIIDQDITLEQFLKMDSEKHINYYPCGTEKEIFYKHSNGYWSKYTYDQNGKETRFENSCNYWRERTFDQNGNCTEYKDSAGRWSERTFDQDGNEKTFENSIGVKFGFENTNSKEVEITDTSNKIQEAIDLLKNHYGNNIKIEILEWVKK